MVGLLGESNLHKLEKHGHHAVLLMGSSMVSQPLNTSIVVFRALEVILHIFVIFVCLLDDVFLDGEVLSEDV